MCAVREVVFDMGNGYAIEMRLLHLRTGVQVPKQRKRKHASVKHKAKAIALLRQALTQRLTAHPFKRRADHRQRRKEN